MTDDSDNTQSPPDFTPVPLNHYRHDGWTPERQHEFIAALAECGSVVNAARSIGMSHGPVYRLHNAPGAEGFNAAWDAALAKATNRVHDVLVDHAIHGAPVPIMFGGEQVGEYRRFSYRMMMWMLRNHIPEQFNQSLDGSGAITDQKMQQLKKQWRAEWDDEQRFEERLKKIVKQKPSDKEK